MPLAPPVTIAKRPSNLPMFLSHRLVLMPFICHPGHRDFIFTGPAAEVETADAAASCPGVLHREVCQSALSILQRTHDGPSPKNYASISSSRDAHRRYAMLQRHSACRAPRVLQVQPWYLHSPTASALPSQVARTRTFCPKLHIFSTDI